MATHWTLGCDAEDPPRLARFWALALGYVVEEGFDGPDNTSLIDPDGRGPAIGFGSRARRRGTRTSANGWSGRPPTGWRLPAPPGSARSATARTSATS